MRKGDSLERTIEESNGGQDLDAEDEYIYEDNNNDDEDDNNDDEEHDNDDENDP